MFAPACSPFVRRNSTKPELLETAAKTDAIHQDLLVQPPPFTSEAVVQAINAVGDLRELGLAKLYTAPGLLQSLLEIVHVSTGFAWIASIAVATVIIRVSLFPFMLKSIRNTTKLAIINPEVKENMAKLTQANKEGDKVAALQAQGAIQKLFKEHDVQPIMAIVPIFIQMPVFIFFYYALNSMVALPVPGMEDGGLFWFKDLTAADPKHILPLATTAMTLVNFEIGAEVGASQGTQMNPAVKMLFRGVMCIVPYFTWSFPTAVFGFWFTSSLFSLIQGFMFRSPAMRKRWNLPPMPSKVVPTAPASGSVVATVGSGEALTKSSQTPAMTGGFWKNFNETVQGVKDMKNSISEKAQAAAAKQRALEEAKPKRPSKFEDMDPKLQQRKIRQQERFASAKRRKQQYSTIASRHFSSTRYLPVAQQTVPAKEATQAVDVSKSSEAFEFGLEEIQGTLLEDMTSLSLDELHEHRELRKYYRKIVYELPSLVEFTKEFVPPAGDQVLQFRYTTYFGEDHPSASKVVLEVDIRKLALQKAEMTKLMKLAGPRVDHSTYVLKMASERFLDPAQNKKYLSDTLDKLIAEAKDTADLFEDIPLDTRHSDKRAARNRRPRFPKSWNQTQNKSIGPPSIAVAAIAAE